MLNRDPAKRPIVDELLADLCLPSITNARPSKGFGISKSMVIKTKTNMGQFKVLERKVTIKSQLTNVQGSPINKENLGARRELFRWKHRPEKGDMLSQNCHIQLSLSEWNRNRNLLQIGPRLRPICNRFPIQSQFMSAGNKLTRERFMTAAETLPLIPIPARYLSP
jgi:hypothetical protein